MRIKENDLVLLVIAKHEQNLGSIGTALKYIGTYTYAHGETVEGAWLVSYARPIYAAGVTPDGKRYSGHWKEVPTPASWLIPLRGDTPDNEAKITLTKPETVEA